MAVIAQDAHEAIDKLSRSTDELRLLYRSLGYRGYKDHKSFGDPDYSEAAEAAKEVLDGILWDIVYYRNQGEVDTRAFKEAAHEQAKKYIDQTELRSPWLTTFVLSAVLDAELAPLSREAVDHSVPGRITSYLPQPWGTLVPALLFVSFACLLGYGAWQALTRGRIGWGLLALGLLVWQVFWRVVVNVRLALGRRKLQKLVHPFQLIRDEVTSGNYDGQEIEARLRKLESDGLYVHSLTYPLLHLFSAESAR